MEEQQQNGFLERFTLFSVKLGNQVHLKSLRDAFATIMPMFILAGLAVMINFVIFPFFFDGERLAQIQVFGTAITNGTLNISAILIAPMIGFYLCRNRNYDNALGSVPVTISALVIMMAMEFAITPAEMDVEVMVGGIMPFAVTGTNGMFAGIIIGLVATELWIRLSCNEKLQINLGDQVPPAVSRTFSTMVPTILVLSGFAIVSAVLISGFHTDLITIIQNVIQAPLRHLTATLPGYLIIFSTGNFLFSLGIHQSVISGSLLDPFMTININENMEALANGETATHILNSSFTTVYAQMGGTGSTISLIIAVLIFVKYKPYRDVMYLSVGPGLFNINEPIIFGLPIVFNLPMIIPFVLVPIVGVILGYLATAIGFVPVLSILVPWTTPPILSGFLASGGDWRVPLLQIIIIAVSVVIFLPFLKISETVSRKAAEANNA